MIPAASIRGLDLEAIAARFPEEARQIEQIGAKLGQGTENAEEMRTLCELLFRVGEQGRGEFLLRRNLMSAADSELYERLFGNTVSDAFEHAVEAFAQEYELELELTHTHDFLDETYHSRPRAPHPHASARSGNPTSAGSRVCSLRESCSPPSGDGRSFVGPAIRFPPLATSVAGACDPIPSARYEVLRGPCTVRFSASDPGEFRAQAVVLEPEQVSAFDLRYNISLRWRDGQWRLIDWRDP